MKYSRYTFVEFRPLRHVGEHVGAFEDVVEGATRGVKDARDVFHHLLSFCFDAAGNNLESVGAIAELTRNAQEVADANCIRNGAAARSRCRVKP